jgi:NitT/TauT family transport system ATP-binding protein
MFEFTNTVSLGTTMLSTRNLGKSFATPEGGELRVLDHVNLDLHEGEIVALLGRSGSGKSTLLRSLIGLIAPTEGEIRYRGQPVVGPMPGMSMIFQSFALFPWLTVLGNVELGLEAQGVAPAERRRRALAAIDLIGLDGFESAYPKELSGGMRQRVGFARALVIEPDVLFMDEPFSALDVLTSENLRGELLDLWQERRMPTRAILIVTHNIEEAVQMADRVVVLAANPGRIRAELPVLLDRPRDRDAPEFRALVDRIYTIMTAPETAPAPAASIAQPGISTALPRVPIEQVAGLLERVAHGPDRGSDDLPILAGEMQLEIDDLFPITDAAALLGLASVTDGDITLLPFGVKFAHSDIQERKALIAARLVTHVPLIAELVRTLRASPDGHLREDRILRELEAHVGAGEARDIFDTAIDWSRYAELIRYDAYHGLLQLDSGAMNA